MFEEVRYALRLVRRSPGFVAAAVLTLALGIGSTTAIFTLTDAVLLHPLDIEDEDRVMALQTKDFRGAATDGFLYKHFVELRQTLAGAMELAIEFPDDVIVATPGGLSRRRAAFVSANYFDVLGRPPARGRGFAPEDDRPGAEPVVILGHDFWTSAFAADPGIVGARVIVSGVPMTVAGIAAPRQRGVDVQSVSDVFLPAHVIQRTTTLPGNTGNYFFQDGSPGWSPGNWWRVFGRLRQDVTAGAVASIAVCTGCAPSIGAAVTLIPIQRAGVAARMRADVSRFSAMLFTAVAVVLLMACANLAGLILARTERRRREIGVRIALGASRTRLAVHLLLECTIVAMLGGIAGILASRWILAGLTSFELPGLISLATLDVSLNERVFAFAAAASVLSALLISVTPIRTAARTEVVSALKQTDGVARRAGVRHALIAAHVAFSVVLLFGAGLFIRSLQAALSIDVGFDMSKVVVADPDVRAARLDDARKIQYFNAATARLSALPGVESVSYGSSAFFLGSGSTPRVIVDGRDLRLPQNVMELEGGPAYVRTLGYRLLRGRDFDSRDRAGAPAVVIVNHAFARRFWPDADPIGHRISVPPTIKDAEVIGVVEDVKFTRLDEPLRLAVIAAWPQQVGSVMRTGLFIRSGDPRSVIPTVRQAIPGIDPSVPITYVRTLREMAERVLLPQRLGSWLLGGFGVAAIVLAVVGIYGLVAFVVAQRTREIGVRIALGAERRDIVLLVAASVFTAVAAGALTGAGLVWWLSRFVTKLLFQVSPHDWIALVATLALLALTAILGAAIPLRRATSVDPIVALRAE